MAKLKEALQSLYQALLSFFNATEACQEELAEASALPTQRNQYYT